MWKGVAIFGIWAAVGATAFGGSPQVTPLVALPAIFATMFVAGA